VLTRAQFTESAVYATKPIDFAATMLRILESSADQERMTAGALATVAGPTGFTLDRTVQGFVDAIQYVRACDDLGIAPDGPRRRGGVL
jgi:hypothetical protein